MLDGLVQKVSDLGEVLLLEPTSGETGGTDADATWCEGAAVADDTIFIERNRHDLARAFELASSESLGLQIPENEVVVGATGAQCVSLPDKSGGEGLGVSTNLLGVRKETLALHI